MAKIIAQALAKVNLMLNINSKTSSGYHEMESIFVFLKDLYDILEFDTNIVFNDFSGNINGVDNSKNSIKLASKILQENFKIRIPHVNVKKYIPIKGGLGGGSSDSACFVNSVFDIWNFPLEEKMKYINIFKPLGSDSVVFLHKYFLNANILFLDGTGIEGYINPINIPELKNKYILLVNNETEVSTKGVFEKFSGEFSDKIGIKNCNFELIKNFKNSLQNTTVFLEPSLKNIISDIELTKPICCGLSGSGSTCFGLYESFEKAKLAQDILNYRFLSISKI